MDMSKNCALYRCEKHEDDGIKWKDEYCDGLDTPICKKKPSAHSINQVRNGVR